MFWWKKKTLVNRVEEIPALYYLKHFGHYTPHIRVHFLAPVYLRHKGAEGWPLQGRTGGFYRGGCVRTVSSRYVTRWINGQFARAPRLSKPHIPLSRVFPSYLALPKLIFKPFKCGYVCQQNVGIWIFIFNLLVYFIHHFSFSLGYSYFKLNNFHMNFSILVVENFLQKKQFLVKNSSD